MDSGKGWPWRKKLEKTLPSPTINGLIGSVDQASCKPNVDKKISQAKLLSNTTKTIIETSPLFQVEQRDEAQEMISSLAHKIVDLSAQLAFREEQASQQSRAAKEAMDDLIAMNDKLAQQAAAMTEMTAGRETMEAEYWAMKEELEEARRQDEARGRWEAETADLRRQLMECAAEKEVLSKSLQERAAALVSLSNAKARAETDLRLLQVRLESLDADLAAQKYQAHLLSKELQLRREECQINQKAADAANRQRLDGVRKVAKLEAECQRLRGLLRQRLPGPAALAQMRAESDHLIGVRKKAPPPTSPARLSRNHNDVHISNMAREIESLTDRLASLEDETALLKETLARRTADLQASRQLCARTASKLSSAEGLLEALARGESPPLDQHKPVPQLPSPASNGGRSHHRECAETMEVMDLVLSSEEGGINDDEISCAESWASALITELSHLKNDESAATFHDQIKPSLADAGHQSCKTNDSVNFRPASAASTLDAFRATLQTLTYKLQLLTDTVTSLESKYPMDDQNNAELRLSLLNALQVCSELKPMLSEAMQAIETAHPAGNIVSVSSVEKTCEDVPKEDAVNIDSDGPTSTAKMALLKVAASLTSLADEAPTQSTDGKSPTVDLHKLTKDLIQDMEDNHGRLQQSSDEEVTAVMVTLLNALRCFFGIKDLNVLLARNSAKGQASDEERSGVEEIGRSGATDQVGCVAMVQSLRAEMEVTKNEKQEMESKLRAAEEELEHKQARLAELEAEVAQLRDANACAEKELADTSVRNSDFEAQLSSAQADVRSLEARVAHLTSELEAQARHSLELQGTVAKLSDAGMPARGRKSTDSDAAPEGKARKERQVTAAKAQLAECQRSILVLGNQLRTLTSAQPGASPMEAYGVTLPDGGGMVAEAAMAQLQVKARSRQYSGFLRTRGGRLISAEQYWGSLSGRMSDLHADGAAATPLHPAACYSLGSQLPAVAPLDAHHAATCLRSPLHDYWTDATATYHHVSPPETALSSPAGSPARFAVQLEQGGCQRGPAAATSVATLLDSIKEAADVALNPAKSTKTASTSRIARLFSRAKNPRR